MELQRQKHGYWFYAYSATGTNSYAVLSGSFWMGQLREEGLVQEDPGPAAAFEGEGVHGDVAAPTKPICILPGGAVDYLKIRNSLSEVFGPLPVHVLPAERG